MLKATRGDGILENFLAKKRAEKANFLIRKAKMDSILDIGCGSYPYFLINSNFKDRYGVDPSLVQLNYDGIKLKKLDISKNKLPFKDNYFDAITMLAVFEHIDQKKLNFVLSEINRVLKRGGIFVITTPSPWADKLLHQMAKIGLISSVEIHEHKHNLSHHNIKYYLETSGFDKSRIQNGFFELSFNMWFKTVK